MKLLSAAAVLLVTASAASAQSGDTFPPDKKARIGGTFYLQPIRGTAVAVCPNLQQKNHLDCPKVQYGKVTIEGLERGLGDIAYKVRLASGRLGYIRAGQEAHLSVGDTSSEKHRQKVECKRKGEPTIGMTMAQVAATCFAKAYHKVNRTMTAAGTHEQHVYPYKSRTAETVYLYFDNGILTAIQD